MSIFEFYLKNKLISIVFFIDLTKLYSKNSKILFCFFCFIN